MAAAGVKAGVTPTSTSSPSTVPPPLSEISLQISRLENDLTGLVDDMAMMVANPLTDEVIIMWSGPSNSIPAGWALCNGLNGTPDLRHRFVRGTTMAGDVRQQGGTTNHTHSLTGHQHPLNVPALSHRIGAVERVDTSPGGLHSHIAGGATGGAYLHHSGFGGDSFPADGRTHLIHTNQTATIAYQATPILFKSDCDYSFGGEEGGWELVDETGVATAESESVITTQTSPPLTRPSLVDAVAEACRGLDYLLITDPGNLRNAYSDSGMINVLTNMAVLAAARKGVLGYYHTIGSINTPFRRNGLVGAGRLFREWDSKEQLFIGQLDEDQILCWSLDRQQTVKTIQMPLPVNLRTWDDMAIGNLFLNSTLSPDPHTREEMVVAWANSEHGIDHVGRVFIYQYEYGTENQFAM